MNSYLNALVQRAIAASLAELAAFRLNRRRRPQPRRTFPFKKCVRPRAAATFPASRKSATDEPAVTRLVAGPKRQLKRLARWTRSAQMTASVASTALNPLVVPIAKQAVVEPTTPLTSISREIDQDRQKDWGNHELQRRRRETAESIDKMRSSLSPDVSPTNEPTRSRDR